MGGGRQPCWSWAHVLKLRPTSETSHSVSLWKCKYCSNIYTGMAKRVRAHLGGVKGRNVEICRGQVQLEVVNKAWASFNRVELMKSSMIAASPQERLALANETEVGEVSGDASCWASGGATGGLGEVSSGSVPLSGSSSLKQSAAPALNGDIRKMMKSAKVKCLDDAMAEFFYIENIPFNTIRRPNLRKLLQAAIDFNPRALAQMMGYEKLRSTQLKKLYDSVNAQLDPIREGWRRYEVSIVTDGWSDNHSQSLINFMASNIQGSVFLKSVDSKGRTKTEEWIWVKLKKVIQEVGEENIVQVITDNASNCVQMGELMTAKYPHILHSRCVCHVLDLLFEDIGSLLWVKPLVKGCNEVVTFITKKPRVLALFRKLSNRDLIKLASTRFAYMFLVMSQLLNLTTLEALKEMCQHLLVLLGLLLKVLKLADREGATSGLIFEAMDRMNEKLSEAIETGILAEEEVEEINRFMMEDHGKGRRKAARWFQMHSILYGAAFILNPAFLHLPLDQEA
ncbi:uncharacterized protein LOC112349814 [Selaginella moellendorffii]|uniref:uncharacterized protein LOC112341827 n=1 Tax=Selaginella moellendorffii TaxID=88036 RepID=UPI000D1C220D|nr:uncharacterized protein LOC112341827 [Selaginella moellendorffii]XP_024540690.1 uncharacterized protein LOC112349814 [Selaginella moellendorffii]|eukprot:XP_024518399.1 uncharacterized protein LOC112341827 [Selaginella moellendorffii]